MSAVYAQAFASKSDQGEVFARHFAILRERRYQAKLAVAAKAAGVMPAAATKDTAAAAVTVRVRRVWLGVPPPHSISRPYTPCLAPPPAHRCHHLPARTSLPPVAARYMPRRTLLRAAGLW